MFRDRAEFGPTVTIMAGKLPTAGPSRVLELFLGFPTVPGLWPIFPAIFTDMVGAGSFGKVRRVSFTAPSLAVFYGFTPVDVFWVIYGGGMPIECSPTLEMEL